MISGTSHRLYKMLVDKYSQAEVSIILEVCEFLSKKVQKQKAEGFKNFHPLYEEFYLAFMPGLRCQGSDWGTQQAGALCTADG
ncbi:DUF1878 family protein [Mesobacillus zeae]|uniref:DUF1878 family protein n=1 Tax=Mesobacillus zeae TaxID=1917180 RepID=A0A398B5B5_9BACI|nr:DUF1878 family protein [Mesobacillus zeae]